MLSNLSSIIDFKVTIETSKNRPTGLKFCTHNLYAVPQFSPPVVKLTLKS